jgi:hypothetical protein
MTPTMRPLRLFLTLLALAAATTQLTLAADPGAPISDKAAVRLRAAGLDPKAPNFAALLKAKLAAVQPVAPLKRVPIVVSKPELHPITKRLNPGLYEHGVIVKTIVTSAPTTFQVIGFSTSPIGLPNFIAVLDSSNKSLADASPIAASITIPGACGYSAQPSGNLIRWDDPVLGQSFAASMGIPITSEFYYAWFNGFQSGPALGATPRAGQITFPGSGVVAAQFTGTFASSAYQVAIANAPPFLAASNALGLQANNTTFGQASVTRFNNGTTDMTGDDIIGQGIAFEKTYTGSAVVVSASSVADVNGNSPADNSYRGASVTVQPQSGRLQTQVHWHIGPGDSLQYVIQWTFTGAAGQRAIPTLPLGGPCDS